ncbi:protein unc-13 homolog 4B-like [Stegodyphus dumicola]|uniref:protein unc-13 homolog 4B-like n=1 Tax=Stegodyphus dumicola TaxID=202533 RepID=UPI0015A7C9AB|nr:protein unc-13 homolog 4B-like [Stegodyphus dumicola]
MPSELRDRKPIPIYEDERKFMGNVQSSNSRYSRNTFSSSVSFNGYNRKPTRRKTIAIRNSKSGNKVLTLQDDYFSEEQPRILAPTTKRKILGSFSEGVKAQKRHLTDEVLYTDYLSAALADEGFDLNSVDLSDILKNDVPEKYLQYIYITISYTINHYLGIPGPTSEGPRKLTQYQNQLIQMNSSVQQENYEKAKLIRAPKFVLNLNVVEAWDLMGKDADNLSDPFCKIWISSKPECIEMTKVKERTIDPVWNETFSFNINSFENDVVFIEIWDKDPTGLLANLREMKRIKNFYGCWLFCNDCCDNICPCGAKSIDDFLGKVKVKVSDIYSEGIDEWMELRPQKQEPITGKIHLIAKVGALRPRNTLDALKRHLLLVKICLQNGLKIHENSDLSITRWEQILNPSANTLIYQHGAQGNISAFEDAICRFATIVHLSLQHISFDYQFLYNILFETNDCIAQSPSIYPLENSAKDIYQISVQTLQNLCITITSHLHSFDLTDNETKRIEFEFLLRCIKLCDEITGLNSSLQETLKLEISKWTEQKNEEMEQIRSESMAEYIYCFLKYLINYNKAADDVFQRVFPKITYTTLVYENLDNHLSRVLKSHIMKITDKSLYLKNDEKQELLAMFVKIKELTDSMRMSISKEETLRMDEYRDWFGPNIIQDWFLWKESIVLARIESITGNDDLKNAIIQLADRNERQSTSVKRTSEVIEKELFELWNLVSHPSFPEYDDYFVSALHRCCMKYAELQIEVSQKLVLDFKNEGKKKLCVIANNFWSLAMFVPKIISKTIGELQPGSPDTKLSLQILTRIFCADIEQEISYDVHDFIQEVVGARSNDSQDKAINEYASFMNTVVNVEAYVDMAFEVFWLFVQEVWNDVLKTILKLRLENKKAEVITCITRFQRYLGRAPNIFAGMLAILMVTEKICCIDEYEKIKELLCTKDFINVRHELRILAFNS